MSLALSLLRSPVSALDAREIDVHGHVHPRFRPVVDVLRRQLDRDNAGGASVCVYHRGACVVDVWAGERGTHGAPWLADTQALSFSTTKGVMSTLVHIAADRGLLAYDQPVARYWPEFAQNGKGRITVRQVLSHTSGLHPIRTIISHADEMLDWDHMTSRLAAAHSYADPDGRSGYHGITYGWLVGELLRRVMKHPLAQIIDDELVSPLGLDGMSLGAPVHERHRVAKLLVPRLKLRATPRQRAFVNGVAAAIGVDPEVTRDALLPEGVVDLLTSTRVLDAEIPAANGVFTARSLARMYAALAGGGTLGDTRLMSRATLAEAGRRQGSGFDVVIGVPMQWRLGYHMVGTTRGVLKHAFGHFGYGGSGAWADPSRELSVAMVLNRVAGTPFGDMRLVRLGGAVIGCL